jgi:pyruvate/2-oxoglutarate dehydrogenase complex dihydrolipoamide dehydrogenase (E3) component
MAMLWILLAVAVAMVGLLAAYSRRASGDYDVVVIGGGSAGLTAAGIAASVGARTLLVERDRLGGECTWTGCVPSKALLKAASVAQAMRTASKYGLDAVEPKVDLARVLERVHSVREHIYREADAPEVISKLGVEVISGRARFVSHEEVEIAQGEEWRRVRFRDAIVCTGTRARIPEVPGLDAVPFVTNETVFSLPSLPRRLLVLGAGPIGVELAQAFVRLGSAVTLVDREPEILPKDAPQLAAIVRERLETEGVRFLLDAELARVERHGEEIHAVLAGSNEALVVDGLLVAIGRAANVEDLGLDVAGVTTNEHGIDVDARCRTSNRRIYACGDVTGRLQFTHYAEHMAKVAVANAALGIPLRLERELVPWVTFSDPELAHVGSRVIDPRRHRLYRFPYAKLDRAVAEQNDTGVIHVHADRRGRIVAASVVGASAGEVIAELALAMKQHVPLGKISDTIHAYPTLSLGARRVADQWYVQNTPLALLRAVIALRGLRGRAPTRPKPGEFV